MYCQSCGRIDDFHNSSLCSACRAGAVVRNRRIREDEILLGKLARYRALLRRARRHIADAGLRAEIDLELFYMPP